MGDYITDSEDEEDLLLLPGVISYLKVAQTLRDMPEPTRQLICSELRRTRFSELVPETINEAPMEPASSIASLLGDGAHQDDATRERSMHGVEERSGISRHNTDQVDTGKVGIIRQVPLTTTTKIMSRQLHRMQIMMEAKTTTIPLKVGRI